MRKDILLWKDGPEVPLPPTNPIDDGIVIPEVVD